MNSNNKLLKILFIIGALLLIIASYLKVSNIEAADYILAIGVLLMGSASTALFIKYHN